jgi:hypothetical protein
MKCASGHKPPVRAEWKVLGAVVCTPCLRAAQNAGIPQAIRINIDRELRRPKNGRGD